MKYPILSILIVFILLQGCVSSRNYISPDETAKKIFTPTELEGIGQMIHFVDSIVSEKTGLTGINESYHAYFDKLTADFFNEKGFVPLLNDTAKFKFFDTMESEAFSAFWIEGLEYINRSTQGRKVVTLDIRGKYMKYLQETGKSDDPYAMVYELTYTSGTILSASVIVWFFRNYHELDFTVYKHRLWATVFLLSIKTYEPRRLICKT